MADIENNGITPMPNERNPVQYFDDVWEGKVVTGMDSLTYLARLLPHLEQETMEPNDFGAAMHHVAAITEAFDKIDPAIMLEGCKQLCRFKNPPAEIVQTLSGMPAIKEIVSHLDNLERYASHAKSTFDLQQKVALAWAPKPKPAFAG